MATSNPRITVRFEGDPADKGYIRLPDFAAKVTAFFKALEATEALLADEERDRVFYKIVELKKESPATLTVEIVARKRSTRSAMVRRFTSTVRDLNSTQRRVPSNATRDQVAAFVALTPTTDTHMAKVTVIPKGVRERKQVVLLQQRPDWIPTVEPVTTEEPDFSYGSVAGHLDWINVHDNANRFYLYPRIGPRIACSFPQRLRPDVERAIGKYVRVYGRLKFLHAETFPKEIDQVTDVDIHEPDDTLPRLADLRGIAPDATGGMNIRDFIESMHDDA